MPGKHRGDASDEAGTLTILDGVVAAVEAERERATFGSIADQLLRNALIELRAARSYIERARVTSVA